MLQPRAYLLLAGLALGSALVSACDRSTTAPQLGQARSELSTAAEQQLTGGTSAASAGALVPQDGGQIDLAALPDYPVHSTLEVPAGTLPGPTYFQITQQVAGAEYVVHVASRVTQLLPEAAVAGDDPILLSLVYAGPERTREVIVDFAPPDGSEPIVVRATVQAGRATVLAYRRGRSKYSVIIF